MGVLDIGGSVLFDRSITNVQEHTYNAYTQSFKYNDEIRIPVQQQDLCLLISDSYIVVDVATVTKEPTETPIYPTNFHVGFLFDEIRYEINGVEIDKNKNVGVTSMMKGYCSYSKPNRPMLEISSWIEPVLVNSPMLARQTYHIPLSMILGFAEDYRKVLINAKHELVLIRSRSNTNCMIGAVEALDMHIMNIQWKVPHIYVSDRSKLMMMKQIDRNKPISMPFRSWDLYEYPALPSTTRHLWAIKTSSQLTKPRFVIVGLQTDRKNNILKDASKFDHCKLIDVSLQLNSEKYPYERMNLDFENAKYLQAYDKYTRFQAAFYNRSHREILPYLNKYEYVHDAPLFVFDCSRQNDAVKTSTVDIRLDLNSKENFPLYTSVYCLIIHDNIVTYNPLTNIVTREI